MMDEGFKEMEMTYYWYCWWARRVLQVALTLVFSLKQEFEKGSRNENNEE